MKEEGISKKLLEVVGPIIPLYYAESETDSYPFAVYVQEVVPRYTKDGPYKYVSALDIYVVAEDSDSVETKSAAIVSAVVADMNAGAFTAKLLRENVSCDGGIWQKELNFTITESI